MSAYSTSKIFVIGGTGAQGIPVIRGLVQDKKYSCRVLTRDTNSARAKKLVALGNVELVTGTFASEKDLRDGFRGCDGAFINAVISTLNCACGIAVSDPSASYVVSCHGVNDSKRCDSDGVQGHLINTLTLEYLFAGGSDGFNCGEKTEIFWTIRAYEIAIELGIKFYIHGNLDYTYKKSGYDPSFRTGHYDGKGRISEWILLQTKNSQHQMGAASFTTGPYIEMSIASGTIFTPTVEEGIVTWRLPLGERGGGVVHVSLDDCAHYVRWMFDNPDKINGQDLEVAIEHVSYHDLAKAFEKATGHPARYIETSLDEYWTTGNVAMAANAPSGYNSDLNDPAAMTFRQNFTGFFNTWNRSWGNNEQSVIKRDYSLMDQIHPHRIKSAEEWFRKEEERGRQQGKGGLWDRVQKENLKPILKLAEDRRQGRL